MSRPHRFRGPAEFRLRWADDASLHPARQDRILRALKTQGFALAETIGEGWQIWRR